MGACQRRLKLSWALVVLVGVVVATPGIGIGCARAARHTAFQTQPRRTLQQAWGTDTVPNNWEAAGLTAPQDTTPQSGSSAPGTAAGTSGGGQPSHLDGVPILAASTPGQQIAQPQDGQLQPVAVSAGEGAQAQPHTLSTAVGELDSHNQAGSSGPGDQMTVAATQGAGLADPQQPGVAGSDPQQLSAGTQPGGVHVQITAGQQADQEPGSGLATTAETAAWGVDAPFILNGPDDGGAGAATAGSSVLPQGDDAAQAQATTDAATQATDVQPASTPFVRVHTAPSGQPPVTVGSALAYGLGVSPTGGPAVTPGVPVATDAAAVTPGITNTALGTVPSGADTGATSATTSPLTTTPVSTLGGGHPATAGEALAPVAASGADAVPAGSAVVNTTAGDTGSAGYVQLPQRFNWLEPSKPIPRDLLPTVLSSMYPEPPAASGEVLEFHWVITSCMRHLWGRMLTSTLISGLANDLRPKTITIVWCKSYNRTAGMPSLLYNMRHSHSFNVMFMNEKEKAMRGHGIRAMVTTLLVPTALNADHLPLLMTEDDVLFAPDANRRLAQAIRKLPPDVQQEPYIIQLYELDRIRPAPNASSEIPQPVDDVVRGEPRTTRNSDTKDVPRYFRRYGAQGYFFSPGMTSIMLRSMLRMQDRAHGPNPDRLANYGQDVIVEDLLRRYQCNNPNSHCHYFRIKPNLVQHAGTSSSLFNQGHRGMNRKYHTAMDFPTRVAFAGFDPAGMW